jgi:hypothetical protein
MMHPLLLPALLFTLIGCLGIFLAGKQSSNRPRVRNYGLALGLIALSFGCLNFVMLGNEIFSLQSLRVDALYTVPVKMYYRDQWIAVVKDREGNEEIRKFETEPPLSFKWNGDRAVRYPILYDEY